ncbi:60S ribosomal protein L9 [Guillardia theta]|uniref:60S ribosomal protein L9 n=1 Tax=Guillardia theta TaxID=55529 RepID=Q9AW64_GUITH|nr:60S ribosomal protein L9 [Guillardia theta]CAC27006.1 60S ribosomal protein L9 [Guillardia theta]
MLTIKTIRKIKIPKNVKIKTKARKISATGSLGSIIRSFEKTQISIRYFEKKKEIILLLWMAGKKQLAKLNTIASHITNMIVGVSLGFEYILQPIYAHFPINLSITDDGSCLEIRNFLGEKRIRKIYMGQGVKIKKNEAKKDEISVFGSDLNLVSLNAASIQQSCQAKNKDLRKFLDGIYIIMKKNLKI